MAQSPAQQARNKLGAAARRGDLAAVDDARQELAVAKLEQHIRESASDLPASERYRLAVMLATEPAAAVA